MLWLIACGWLSGCASRPAGDLAEVARLPEVYEEPAETPSSFVARPIYLGSSQPHPGGLRVVREHMVAEAMVEYVVDTQGAVVACQIVETNHPRYAEAVRAWLSAARFVPGVKAGQNVTVRLRERFFIDVGVSPVEPVRRGTAGVGGP